MTSSVLAGFLLPLVVSTMAVDLPYFCGFEDPGLCGMEHREGGDFNWTRYNQSTPSSGTGPKVAAEGGWYMYIESSEDEGRVKGDKAYIQTPAIEYAGDVCIRFQYHMYGRHIGRLVVFVYRRGENSTPAFTKSGDQTTTWQPATINVEDFKTGERVVFMAECGNGYLGDIAIDDLHIANETCHDCQVNNGGCEHVCRSQGGWVACSCHDGYIKHGPRCLDVDECLAGNECHHFCHNFDGGYRCDCDVGYVLTGDDHNCADIDECLTTKPCQQVCQNLEGGYLCGCHNDSILSNDQRRCKDCVEAYSKVVDADQAFESSCATDILLFNEPPDQCLREACRRGVEVVAVRNEVCDFKFCHDGDIQLAASAGSFGWDIFVLNRTWSESNDDQLGTGQDHPDFPLWQVVVAVIVVVLAVIAFAVGIVLYLKRRKMASQTKEPDRVYYENDAALTTRSTGDFTKPADEAPYEEVGGPSSITSSYDVIL